MLYEFLNRITFFKNFRRKRRTPDAGHRTSTCNLQPSDLELKTQDSRCKIFIFVFAMAIFALACTAQSKDLKSSEFAPGNQPAPEPTERLSLQGQSQLTLQALEKYKETLRSRGELLDSQGILIESLDGKQTIAAHNADNPFNPASVMKLATSLVALEKFSPAHRYRTNFLADGQLDKKSRQLLGDLVVEGNADPMFSKTDAEEVAKTLAELGISRVTGGLRIAGSFYFFARGYKRNLSHETSAVKLREALQRAGIRIHGSTVTGEAKGTLLIAHYSDTLPNLLLYQNAHSSNAIAEVIGESLGGAATMQDFLTRRLQLKEGDLYVGHPSGLEFNRITPRASLKILRALIATLDKYSLKPEDIMPVAGVDSGTLMGRFTEEEFKGAVIAKTGTLFSTDRGVSTLVGLAFTKSHGTLLFAVFNSDGRVRAYRHLQDDFIEETIAELGGASRLARNEDALAEKASGAIVQRFYKE
jgi:D-alanyl-D-alanine carboxypeptidase/D-alanyl-D-alanine-endopeptidase (penicillin-binding protein 4)